MNNMSGKVIPVVDVDDEEVEKIYVSHSFHYFEDIPMFWRKSIAVLGMKLLVQGAAGALCLGVAYKCANIININYTEFF